MKKITGTRTVGLTALAASLATPFGPASAQDDEVTRLIRPESSVELGAGYLTDDAIRFGQYTGLKDSGLYGIGTVDYVRRDDQTGTWYRVTGLNLGLESRELRFEHERQGDWRYSLEYNKIPRFSQYEVNTGLQGIGHDVQTPTTITAGTGFDKRLKTEREGVTVAGQKMLGNGLDVQVRFKNETKDGARLFGRGTPSVQQFLAEPIDHTMQQVDVILGYTGEKLQLSGGYYGSFFRNENSALHVAPFVGFPNTDIRSFSPIALPPDNQAHQVYLSGGYSFTPTTRANFKVSRGVATQDDSFVTSTSLAPLTAPSARGRTDLNGEVETTLAQVGLTARPVPKLSLLANLKYEDRDDETPERVYFTPTTTFSGTNEPRSLESTTGRVEASYLLPADFRLTGGVDYDQRKRNTFDARLVTVRKEVEEIAYRVELRRSLSETLNGSVAYIRSERDGSRFLPASSLVAPNAFVAPLHMADRDRNKVRLKLDWAPVEPLSLQFLGDFSEDEYGGGAFGLEDGSATFWSLDASYALNEEWQASAWVSRDYSRIVNTSRSGTNVWDAKLRLKSEAYGLGLRGSVGSAWTVGGDIQYSQDRSSFDQTGTTVALTDLPKVHYRLTTVKLFGEYAVRRDLSVRMDVIYDKWRTNDWQWESYQYSDGTRLSQDETQETAFVGVSMRYAWH